MVRCWRTVQRILEMSSTGTQHDEVLFFKQLHNKSTLLSSLDPFQFAYWTNRSTDDAVSTALHTHLTHLDRKNSNVRMLFKDFSSAFYTIIPQQLIQTIKHLGLSTMLCNWLLDFCTDFHTVCIHHTEYRAPYPANPWLHNKVQHKPHCEVCRWHKVSWLLMWCNDNNLSLNVKKTKEIIVNFWRAHTQHPPLTINCAFSTKFMGVHLNEDLSWTRNTSALAKKAQKCLYFLDKLRKARAPVPIMVTTDALLRAACPAALGGGLEFVPSTAGKACGAE